MLRMIVGPALRNQGMVRRLSHSCAPSELAVGFWWIRVPSGHGADWRSAMDGCVATAGRHSLLSLPRLLVNCNELQVPRSGTYIMKPTASCEAAQLWVHMPQKWVPWKGTYASRILLRMIVGPALRNQEMVRWCLLHFGLTYKNDGLNVLFYVLAIVLLRNYLRYTNFALWNINASIFMINNLKKT